MQGELCKYLYSSCELFLNGQNNQFIAVINLNAKEVINKMIKYTLTKN